MVEFGGAQKRPYFKYHILGEVINACPRDIARLCRNESPRDTSDKSFLDAGGWHS